MRCLTLAEELNGHGTAVRFVCREHEGHMCDLIESRGFVVARLPAPGPGDYGGQTDYADWIGASWQDDAEQTHAAIASWGEKQDWLVADHYGIDSQWESALRASVDRVMVIDDLANRLHDCDLLLDQNLVEKMDARYDDKLSRSCAMLLGPDYALLQPTYRHLHESVRARQGAIRRIFISFGGADNGNLTGRSLAVFLSLERPDIEIDVVIDTSSPNFPVVREQAAGQRNVHIHSDLPSLAALMAAADLGIGAAGGTSWERLCVGLPALVIVMEANQAPIAETLTRRELIRLLGDQNDLTDSTLSSELTELIDSGLQRDWSERCLAVVDGCGVSRVRAAMTVTSATRLETRRATLADEALWLTFANDPITRRNAFSPDPISPATHQIWFRSRMEEVEASRLYIVATEEGMPVGQVRFARDADVWEIHFSLAAQFRGRGLGRRVVGAAIETFGAEMPSVSVVGRVKRDNLASRRVFEALGFHGDTISPDGIVVFRRVLDSPE
jgi:UDP-2,4-diacetamido-2,4,6-trideoxy-beta-L-altropyranose hydrolase